MCIVLHVINRCSCCYTNCHFSISSSSFSFFSDLCLFQVILMSWLNCHRTCRSFKSTWTTRVRGFDCKIGPWLKQIEPNWINEPQKNKILNYFRSILVLRCHPTDLALQLVIVESFQMLVFEVWYLMIVLISDV